MTVSYEIDLNENYNKVHVFFEEYPAAMDAVCQRVGTKETPVEAMTVKDLCELLDGRIPSTLSRDVTVREWGEMVNGLRNSLEGFANFMKRTTPPMTAAQKKLMGGVLETTSEEAVLLTCKDFYNLHTLEEAQKLSVYEYMIARKAIYNERIQAYNMEMDTRSRAGGRSGRM